MKSKIEKHTLKKKESDDSNRYMKLKANIDFSQEASKLSMKIFHSLLNIGVNKEYFAENVKYLSKEIYEDVNLERAIGGLCGYPLCDRSHEIVQKQKYIIRRNRVYDITKALNFCCPQCYEASDIVAMQIPSTPLYLRISDDSLKCVKITFADTSKVKGKYGELVDITGLSEKANVGKNDVAWNELIENDEDITCTPHPNLDEISQNDTTATSKSVSPGKTKLISPKNIYSHSTTSNSNLECNGEQSVETHKNDPKISLENLPDPGKCLKKDYFCEISSGAVAKELERLHISNRGDDSIPCDKCDRASTSRLSPNVSTSVNVPQNDMQHIYQVECYLKEWMSFESLRLILGDRYVSGMLEELGETLGDVDQESGLTVGMDSKAKYISLCRKLDQDELNESMRDAEAKRRNGFEHDRGDSDPPTLQPVPDYAQLEKDVKEMTVKVRDFYGGSETKIPDTDLATQSHQIASKSKTEENSNKNTETHLPLIDHCSQISWRRRIVLDRLKKPFIVNIEKLGLDSTRLWSVLSQIISSFDLSSTNINMTVRQWNIVSFVLIKMISVRYSVVGDSMKEGSPGFDHISDFLREEKLDAGYLDRMLSYLTEIAPILSKHRPSQASNSVDKLLKSDDSLCHPSIHQGRSSCDNKTTFSSSEVLD